MDSDSRFLETCYRQPEHTFKFQENEHGLEGYLRAMSGTPMSMPWL